MKKVCDRRPAVLSCNRCDTPVDASPRERQSDRDAPWGVSPNMLFEEDDATVRWIELLSRAKSLDRHGCPQV